MATIDLRGLVDDGTSSLTVAGSVVAASHQVSTSTLVSGSATLAAPGAYVYNGGLVTVPSAATFPGSVIVFAPAAATSSVGDLYGGGLILTGTAVRGAAGSVLATNVFAAPSPGAIDAVGGTKIVGQKLTLGASGSVVMVSDSNYWLVMSHSGSLTFA